MIEKLAGPWLAKGFVVATLMLCISAYMNAKQWQWSHAADIEHAAEIKGLQDAGKIATLELARDQSIAIANAATQKHDELVARFDAIALQSSALNDAYWKRLGKIPPLPAGCGPGQSRVDNFNDRSR